MHIQLARKSRGRYADSFYQRYARQISTEVFTPRCTKTRTAHGADRWTSPPLRLGKSRDGQVGNTCRQCAKTSPSEVTCAACDESYARSEAVSNCPEQNGGTCNKGTTRHSSPALSPMSGCCGGATQVRITEQVCDVGVMSRQRPRHALRPWPQTTRASADRR